jgi:predicted  nucleic acid-binding Zn-ribbon protein
MDLHNMPIPEVLSGAFLSGPVFWLFFKRIMLKSAKDTTGIKSEEAKTDVIELLRSEIERLNVSNTKLADSLNELQVENIKLRQEILDLRSTINELVRRESSPINNFSRHQPNQTKRKQ